MCRPRSSTMSTPEPAPTSQSLCCERLGYWLRLLPFRLPPLHLLDFGLLGLDNFLGQLLDLWPLPLVEGLLRHLNGTFVVRHHVMEKLDIVPSSQWRLGWHLHARDVLALGGRCALVPGIPPLLHLADLAVLILDDLTGERLQLRVLRLLQSVRGHVHCALMVRRHVFDVPNVNVCFLFRFGYCHRHIL